MNPKPKNKVSETLLPSLLHAGVVEERAKATKKAIDSIVPSRPTEDKVPTKFVDDLQDRFTNRLSKKQEAEYR